ncbi:MAG: nucleotidyltransferase domain-containing protein [Candidatus Micrarchaeaceae archaeon]
MARIPEKDLPARLNQVREFFTGCPNVLAAFLFGSQVDGYATPQSDIDLAVLFEHHPSLEEELALGSALCEILETERVDVVNLNRAHLLLRHRAICGRLLYERDRERVSDFIETTIRHYVDYVPDLAAYYRDYDQALEEAYGIRQGKGAGEDPVH